VTSWREIRRKFFAPGDLLGAVYVVMDEAVLLKVRASGEQIRFDPANWFVRRNYRATLFGRKLEYNSFKISGWQRRSPTEQELAYEAKLFDDANALKLTDYKRGPRKHVDFLEWPIIMSQADQQFPEAFGLLVRVLGPKPQTISVSGFNQLKKEALWQVLQWQRKSGKVDPALEAATHWSM
jgi:hypothetical protein